MVFQGSGLLFRMNTSNSNSKHYLPFLYSVLFSMQNDSAVFVMKCPSHFSNQTICLSKCLLKFIANNTPVFAKIPVFLHVTKGGLKSESTGRF